MGSVDGLTEALQDLKVADDHEEIPVSVTVTTSIPAKTPEVSKVKYGVTSKIVAPKSEPTVISDFVDDRWAKYENGFMKPKDPIDFSSVKQKKPSAQNFFKSITTELAYSEEQITTTVKGLSMPLFRHQAEGLAFLRLREASGTSSKGGLICDDMGLGKSVLSIALILSKPPAPRSENKITLIVCPVSLLAHWQKEIESKSNLKVYKFHGKNRDVERDFLNDYNVITTSYHTLASEFKRKDSSIIYKAPFHRVILDEAQYIRNRHTSVFKSCDSLLSNRRWCLSGTPIQNKLKDLASLLTFARIHDYKLLELLVGDTYDEDLFEIIRKLLSKYMIRRTKEELSNTVKIPSKTMVQVHVKIFPAEREIYNRLYGSDSCSSEVNNSYTGYLSTLVKLCQAASHWKNIQDSIEDSNSGIELEVKNEASIDGLTTSLGGLSLSKKTPKSSDAEIKTEFGLQAVSEVFDSAKIRALRSILDASTVGKTVVFTQYLLTMREIARKLSAANYNCLIYEGSMKPHQKDDCLTLFSTDPSIKVLVCSIKCSAVGLNLTAACRVVMFDEFWNPKIHDQAVDRVHRIGQLKEVTVYELMALDTVEMRIVELQKVKRKLSASILDPSKETRNQEKSNCLSLSEIKEILEIEQNRIIAPAEA